jgi:alpha-2-macroglobulin
MKALRYLLIALVLLVPGCVKDHKETVPDELSEILGLKIDRPLEVVLGSPQGKTSGPEDYESVSVVFNQPMKALSAEAPPIAEPFKLAPPAKGTFRWKGTATVSFEPEEPLPYGTEYTVTVPAGLKSPGGNALKEAYTFKFVTPGPQVIGTQPTDGSKGHKDGEPIFLFFDQPVVPEAVATLVSFTTPSNATAPSVRPVTEEELKSINKERPEDNPALASDLVAVVPRALEPKTTYTLKLDKGLAGLTGSVKSEREHLVTFTSLGPLEWESEVQKGTDAPERSVPFQFSNKVTAKNLKEHLKVDPEIEIKVSEYDEEDDWNRHSFYLPLEPNSTYTFTIDGDLTDVHGQQLGKDATFTWKTGDREPLANVPEGIAVLEAHDTLTIPMGLRNIDKITYRMAKLDRTQLMSLLARSDRDWLWGDKPSSLGQPFSVTKTVKPDGPHNELYTYKLDLREALKTDKYGFVYYQVELHSKDEVWHRRGLAQVTNLGATGKFSPENSVFFASTLDMATPVDGVEATVLDGKGRPVWQGKSDQEGLIKAPGWSDLLTDAKTDEYSTPTMYLVLKKGQDEVYIENGGFGEIYTWQFHISQRWATSPHYLTSEVYSERGLYRPGEEVHLKGSLRDREKGEWTLPQTGGLTFVVKDSRDQKIEEGKVELSEFGTFNHTVTLGEKAPTGSYRVDYSMNEALAKTWGVSSRITGATFRVEEFEAAQFEVNVNSKSSALVMGDKASFEVEAKWLFGAPMVESEVEWSARIEPAVYSSKDYPGYHFGPSYDPDDDRDDTKTLKEAKASTDSKGLFSSDLMLEGVPYKGDADLVIEATVTSSNRRSITGSKLVPVARGDYRVGLKPSSTFVPSEAPVDVQLVTLTPDGKPVGAKDLSVELIRREWSSVKKSDVDGRFRWVTEVEDKTVETTKQTSAKDVTTVKVTPKEAGYYIVRATGTDDKKNTIVSETSLYAHGSGYVPWGRAEGDGIELVPDKTTYAPGETAQILIKNPFEEATALVTYERDLILHSYTTTLKGSAPVIEVPLTEEHLPNLYVSVMLFRGRIQPPTKDDNEDIGKPAFKIGYLELPVSPDSKKLKVTIETDHERYGPQDEVVTKLKVTDAQGKPVRAELSLTAADVGVLNLINFQTPDLFDTYYGSLPLAVKTGESRRDVIGQRSYGTKGEDQGGGGGYNPGFRKDFKTTAVWEPQVVTDSNGEAEVRFNLPENLTTFRVMATAITGDTRCGAAEHEIISTKPLILKPSTPAFARIGDEFQAGVLAVNGTDKGATVKVSMESEGVKATSNEPQEIFLKANEEREVLFTYRASEVGTATLRFSGTMDGADDGVEFQVPLQLATQKVNLAHTGHLDEADLKQPLEVPKTALPKTADLRVSLSSSILLGLEDSVTALLDYPYGCLEQRLSRVAPLLQADELVSRLELKGWNEAKVKAQVQKSLDLMPSYAHSSGGLKVWPDSKYVHPLLTANAVSTAHIAAKQGYQIKGVWLEKARGYLKAYLDGKTSDSMELSKPGELVCQAAALEALTKYGFSGKAYLNKLMDKRDKMPVTGKALLLKAAYRLDEKKSVQLLAQELTNSIKIENATAYFDIDESTTPWLFSSDVGDTGLVLEALLTTEQKMPLSDKVVAWLLEARNDQGTWGTTANNAAALSALVAYSKTFEGSDPSFSVKVSLDGHQLGEESFEGKSGQKTLSENLKSGARQVELKKSGEGRLYYNIALSYEDTEPSPAKDEGLTVLRSVTDLDDKPVGSFVGGRLYKVKLSVIAPDLRRYVVLRDPVPAGLSVVKTDFATESQKLSDLLKRGSQPSWMTFHRFEDYSDRVLLFADALAPGEHTYEYLVRAQTPGTYLHPAAQAEEMYHPELFGRTAERTITVK